jgi:hypothetical protein
MLRFSVSAFRFLLLLFLATGFQQMIMAQSTSPPVPPAWQTHADKTDYRETPRY